MDAHIKQLVEKYPNDFELGSKVRELYWLQHENSVSNPLCSTVIL